MNDLKRWNIEDHTFVRGKINVKRYEVTFTFFAINLILPFLRKRLKLFNFLLRKLSSACIKLKAFLQYKVFKKFDKKTFRFALIETKQYYSAT